MRKLEIEWRHLEMDGKTCVRCSETGKTLSDVVADLTKELAPKGVIVDFIEITLPEKKITESNMVLFNGRALEEVLPEIVVSENCCESCSCITGSEAYCRTVEYDGQTYEEIPEDLIYKAAYRVLGIEE
ncbi:MAG TPA: DUF2703 domain-containing protein [Candidatus Aquicultor sp.]|jgi:hypothetical protein